MYNFIWNISLSVYLVQKYNKTLSITLYLSTFDQGLSKTVS